MAERKIKGEDQSRIKRGERIRGDGNGNALTFFLIHPWLIHGDGLIFTISRSLTTLKSRATHRLIDTKRGEVPLTDSFPSVQGLKRGTR